jgi:hypothetical protein
MQIASVSGGSITNAFCVQPASHYRHEGPERRASRAMSSTRQRHTEAASIEPFLNAAFGLLPFAFDPVASRFHVWA